MKRLIFLLVSIGLISCQKSKNTPQRQYTDVLYWTSDTLISSYIYFDSTKGIYEGENKWDTVFAISLNGHTGIQYHGVNYYIKTFIPRPNGEEYNQDLIMIFDVNNNIVDSGFITNSQHNQYAEIVNTGGQQTFGCQTPSNVSTIFKQEVFNDIYASATRK